MSWSALVAIHVVMITKSAKCDLRRVPSYIADKLLGWVKQVEQLGLEEIKKIPGYHDELLRGDRKGQRSIRLSRSYRAIYVIKFNGHIEFISIKEISKHDY